MDFLKGMFTRSEHVVKEHNPTKKIEVQVINKRTLGVEIIRLCGNEGTDDTPEKASLRRLLQGCITLLGEHSEHYWSNADLRVFTKEGEEYCFQSGSGKHLFVALYDENDKLYIRKRK